MNDPVAERQWYKPDVSWHASPNPRYLRKWHLDRGDHYTLCSGAPLDEHTSTTDPTPDFRCRLCLALSS